MLNVVTVNVDWVWVGVPWMIPEENPRHHSQLGVPCDTILYYVHPDTAQVDVLRVFLTMSDGRCAASVVAMWLRRYRPFDSRKNHAAACDDVITTIKVAAQRGKPNYKNAKPFAELLVIGWKVILRTRFFS